MATGAQDGIRSAPEGLTSLFEIWTVSGGDNLGNREIIAESSKVYEGLAVAYMDFL